MDKIDKNVCIKLSTPLILGIVVFILQRFWGMVAPEGCSANAWLYLSIF